MMTTDIHLATALAEVVIFLEFTPPEFLNEDIAVEAMEQLAARLQRMSEPNRRALAKSLIDCAEGFDDARKNFVQSLPKTLGIV